MEATVDNRYDRKKAATRLRITDAGHRLFASRGFDEVSMEDIAAEADLAVRTLYLHFESKAGILLAHFDAWLDVYVAAVAERPVDEPIARTMEAALARVREAGLDQNRRFSEIQRPYPVVEYIGGGNPVIAGHAMQAWVNAQSRMIADAKKRGGYPDDSVVPHARAAAHFAVWIGTVIAFRQAFDGEPIAQNPSHSIAETMMESFGGGLDR
jgi:AcrR family transcriptional regulator